MSEILLHPGDPSQPVRTMRISRAGGTLAAVLLVAAGTSVVVGLLGAPDLVSDLVRSADRLALRETARRSAEAYSSVVRQTARLGGRLSDDELFLARLAAILRVDLPDGFPGDAPPAEGARGGDLNSEVAALARRLRAAELFRRRIGASSRNTAREATVRIPSRAPVEPSSAVPVVVYGPRESPATHASEFFPGLELAAPEGTRVISPADGTVVFAGTVPSRLGATWRVLGTTVVVANDPGTVTLFGHLARALVRPRQRVRRGDVLGTIGRSGFTPAPRLHYEVRRLEQGRWVPRDPRLFVLDAAWITAAEVRRLPEPPSDADLPPPLH